MTFKDRANFIAPLRWETPDFTLRCYELGDVPELNRAVCESIDHLKPWMPWAATPPSLEETERVVRGGIKRYLGNEDFMMGIWAGDRLVGGTGFHNRIGSWESATGEIGIWIAADSIKKGLATRVTQAMLNWGVAEWQYHRYVWRCLDSNIASARVAERVGMRYVGTMTEEMVVYDVRHNMRYYEILASEWRNR